MRSRLQSKFWIRTFTPGTCVCLTRTWTPVQGTNKMSTWFFGTWFLVPCVLFCVLSLAQGTRKKSFCWSGSWILGAKTEISQAWLKVWMKEATTCFVIDWSLLFENGLCFLFTGFGFCCVCLLQYAMSPPHPPHLSPPPCCAVPAAGACPTSAVYPSCFLFLSWVHCWVLYGIKC